VGIGGVGGELLLLA
jgi:hypothetical protein